MKTKKILFIVLVGLFTVLCSLGFVNKTPNHTVFAADSVNCFTMLLEEKENIDETTTYTANSPVGIVTGETKHALGSENVEFIAEANTDFQIVGWRVVYKEQSDKTIFIDAKNLVDNKKEVILTSIDELEVAAEISFQNTTQQAIFNKSTFKLTKVFEDMSITPVFDRSYYQLKLSQFSLFKSFNEPIDLPGEKKLFYKNKSINDGVTTYSEAIIVDGLSAYYYGTLYSKDEQFYTIHKTLEESPKDIKVDYAKGAFVLGDEIKTAFEFNITSDLNTSSNVDVIGAEVVYGKNAENNLKLVEDINTTQGYKITKDSWKRTTKIEINFDIVKANSAANVFNIKYHHLYAIKLNIMVDGELANGTQLEEVYGVKNIGSHKIEGNVTLTNFYSKNEDNTQFLVKRAVDNGSVSFDVSTVDKIGKNLDGKQYTYYMFESFNGARKYRQSYKNIDTNQTIVIEFSSQGYNISFKCLELVNSQYDKYLTDLDAGELEGFTLNRGQERTLTESDLMGTNIFGYEFVGYSSNNKIDDIDSVTKNYTVKIDENKPDNVLVYAIYKKVEYSIKFTNFNKDGNKALRSVGFNVVNLNETIQSKTYSQADLESATEIDTGIIIKIGGNLEITHIKNAGFKIVGYSCKPTITSDEDYFDKIVFSREFIENNISHLTDNVLTIYVFEEVEKYTITYIIEPTLDSKIGDEGEEVIMANISASIDADSDAEIVEYDLADNDITNKSGIVAKIVISNLGYGEKVRLFSEALSVGLGADKYYYMFNKFTADRVTELSKILVEQEIDGKTIVTSATHEETTTMGKEIYVIYSMPETKLIIQADEETLASANFNLNVRLTQEGSRIDLINGEYKIESKEFKVDITPVFGFELIGYEFNGNQFSIVSGSAFVNIAQDMVKADYVNRLILKFKKLEYQFQFKQHRAGKTDEFVMFGEDDFINLTLDNDEANQSNESEKFVSLIIQKPEGYFVKNVTFSNDGTKFSSVALESNELGNDLNRNKFIFKISINDFETLVNNKASQEGGFVKVLVHLYYEIFTYSVTINRTITNSQGISKDLGVILPTFKATNLTNGQQVSVGYNENMVIFRDISYGDALYIELITEPSKGMGKLGYRHVDNYVISYSNQADQLTIHKIANDAVFDYEIYYQPVEVAIEQKGLGNVSVLVNNAPSKSVLLFNGLAITAKGNENQGYVFKQISYQEIKYVEYEHTEESWEKLKDKLYLKDKYGQYYLNQDATYSNQQYYIREIEEVVILSEDINNQTVFSVSEFSFERFNIEDIDGKLQISFVVEFKMLELTIKNIIHEDDSYGKLTEAGVFNNQTMLKFNKDEFATFTVVKIDEERNRTDISNGGTITYSDTFIVGVQINQNAINAIDGKEYDLSLGLELDSVVIYTSLVATPGSAPNGKYEFTFEVKTYFAYFVQSEVFEINYKFIVKNFKLEATTNVQDSKEFYNNVTLHINADSYGFAESSVSSENMENKSNIVLEQRLQYLAFGKTYIKLSDRYKNDFIIYGINAYLNGTKLKSEDFGKYSIEPLTGDGDENCFVFQMYGDLKIEFLIRPNITFNNGGPNYKKQLKYDAKGNALEQCLTVGSTSKDDLQVSNMLVNAFKLIYKQEGVATSTTSVRNAGKYFVEIGFNVSKGDAYEWLRNIKIQEEIVLEILKKEISLSYDKQKIEQVIKTYDGTSAYAVANVYQWLQFTDGKNFKINFKDAMLDGRFTMAQIDSFISKSGKDGEVKDADETRYYNFYLYNLAFDSSNPFNNNYHLLNDYLIIENFIQIARAELQIQNLQVYSKVYDGTKKAELVEGVKLSILGVIPGDDVSLNDMANITLEFEDELVGTNKKVVVDATNAITGESAHNYYVASSNVQGLTIYPHKLTAKLEGEKTIELFNDRGLTDRELIDLIPVGAKLEVVAFKKDGSIYRSIYSKIRSKVRGRNEFVVGYQIILKSEDGKEIPIDSNLYLSIPSIKDLTGAFYLYENKTGEVTSTVDGKNLLIDLQPIEGNIEYVFLIHRKTMLKPWQITLIVISSVLVVGGGVLTFILIRKFKKGKDSVHEKI